MKRENYNEKIFDEFFEKKISIDYSKYRGKPSRRDRKIRRILNKYGMKNCYCLDVCPGTGRWLQYLKDNEAKFLAGIDISQKSINKFSKLCDHVQKANVENEEFDFESNFFDIVI